MYTNTIPKAAWPVYNFICLFKHHNFLMLSIAKLVKKNNNKNATTIL
jgi:hypothetical protein